MPLAFDVVWRSLRGVPAHFREPGFVLLQPDGIAVPRSESFVYTAGEVSHRLLLMRYSRVRVTASGLRWPLRSQAGLVAVCALPALQVVVHAAVAPSTSVLVAVGWSLYFAVLCWAGVFLSFLAWRLVQVAAQDIDSLLGSQVNRQAVRTMFRAAAQERRQFTVLVGGGIGFDLLLMLVTVFSTVPAHLYIGPSSFVSVGLAGGIVALASYWLVLGVRIMTKVRTFTGLLLLWPAPGRTPGIESLARLARLSALIGGTGTVVFAVPVLWIDSLVMNEPVVTLVKWAVFTLALGATLLVAILPQLALSRTVARFRTLSIRTIEAAVPGLAEFAADPKRAIVEHSQMLTLLNQVASSPSTTVNDRTIVAIFIGLSAVVLPYVVQVLAR